MDKEEYKKEVIEIMFVGLNLPMEADPLIRERATGLFSTLIDRSFDIGYSFRALEALKAKGISLDMNNSDVN